VGTVRVRGGCEWCEGDRHHFIVRCYTTLLLGACPPAVHALGGRSVSGLLGERVASGACCAGA
jgi:hypothetical protein